MRPLSVTIGFAMLALTLPAASAPQSAQPPAASKTQLQPGPNFFVKPILLKKVRPKYPAEALAHHIQGRVTVEVIVGKDGVPEKLRLLSGPTALADASLDAVKQWRYEPGKLNGRAISSAVVVGIDYAEPNRITSTSGTESPAPPPQQSLSATPDPASTSDITLSGHLRKQSYFSGERIYVDMQLTNNTGSKQSMETGCWVWSVRVSGPGIEPPRPGEPYPLVITCPGGYNTLAPGASFEEYMLLNDASSDKWTSSEHVAEWADSHFGGRKARYDMSKPGTYQVRIERGGIRGGNRLDLTVTVEKPKN